MPQPSARITAQSEAGLGGLAGQQRRSVGASGGVRRRSGHGRPVRQPRHVVAVDADARVLPPDLVQLHDRRPVGTVAYHGHGAGTPTLVPTAMPAPCTSTRPPSNRPVFTGTMRVAPSCLAGVVEGDLHVDRGRVGGGPSSGLGRAAPARLLFGPGDLPTLAITPVSL